ncbi:uncharacterized protein BJ171DRAFT_427251 [Polychytrium aggregatum]|uniref:uncharacterized protein n=1 Tax=Polychytrium aggregatum TaxID=110093 RepID=UPI0022FF295E|nr:uncharacterized protein BJ171DRAFT_427251 [Polychytrium aggregatum]KAI9199866.1 hypothetical protein BJ171DRAFT_427251 [Polychytrium aggregatum]
MPLPGGPADSKFTLWMGDLDPWMDENYLRQLWYNMGENVMAKVVRDRNNTISAGYAYVDFPSYASAARYLASVNGTLIPGTNRVFKLNWASGLNDRRYGLEFSIFVGDLAPEIDDYTLMITFQSRFASCKTAKVVMDSNNGVSKGYGFVRFTDESEQQRALHEMQGQYCGPRPMRISMATPKNRPSRAEPQHNYPKGPSKDYPENSDPNNTTIFVGGVGPLVTEEDLRACFMNFGEIVYTKIPPGKGCGFVQFVHRPNAEQALQHLNGYVVAGSKLRLTWGRSHSADRYAYQTGYANQYAAAAAAAGGHYSHPIQHHPPPAHPVHPAYSAQPMHQAPPPIQNLPPVENSLHMESVDAMNGSYMRQGMGVLEKTELEEMTWRK